MTTSTFPQLRVRDLRKHYSVASSRRPLVALDGVSLDVNQGETLAIVGESGSGKSTLARCIVSLVKPTGGTVELSGRTISGLSSADLSRSYRHIQMVFQDPNSSLNPRMTVRQVLHEPLRLQLGMGRRQREERALELVEIVGMTPAHLDRLPHQLSGGQRQRIGIARAIAVEPDVVILDEPTASLDVSVRGQILDLLAELQERLRITYIFITHDLHVVERIADRIAVMYLGGVIEQGPAEQVLHDPRHPYTRALLSAVPEPEYGVTKERIRLVGEIPSPIDLPEGCRLVGRCPLAQPSCHSARPPLVDIGAEHLVACPITT